MSTTNATIRTINPLIAQNTQKASTSPKEFNNWRQAASSIVKEYKQKNSHHLPRPSVEKNATKISASASKQATSSQTTSVKIQAMNDQSTMVEGVQVEGFDTLTSKQKQNLKKQLHNYQEKIKSSIKDGSFDKFIEMAFGRKVDNPAELIALKKAAISGDWDKVIPKIKMGDETIFNTATVAGKKVNAMGAFIAGSGDENNKMGTIILRSSLLDGPITLQSGEKVNFQNILTEEIAHSWDAKLNINDSKGDEGEALSVLLSISSVNREGFLNSLKVMKSQGANVEYLEKANSFMEADLKRKLTAFKTALADNNDHGTLTITNADGTTSEIDVEFLFGIGKALKKRHKKVTNKLKDIAKKAVKDFVKFQSLPFRALSRVLPAGNFIESTLDKVDDLVDKSIEKLEELEQKTKDLAKKAWKKFEKEVLQSKWLGPVLTVMSFIPIFGTVAMVARLALAAYQIERGLESGNWGAVAGGIVSVVAGASAAGAFTSATAISAASTIQTGYAVYRGVDAIKSGNYGAALGAFASAAGQTGSIDASTVSNLTSAGNMYTAVHDKDWTAAVRIGSEYAAANSNNQYAGSIKNAAIVANTVLTLSDKNKTDAQKARAMSGAFTATGMISPETDSLLAAGLTVVDEDASDEDKVAALAKLGMKSGILNKKSTDIITAAATISKITKDGKMTEAEKLAAASRQLQNIGLLNDKTSNIIIDSTDLYTRARAGDVKGVGNIAQRYDIISPETNELLAAGLTVVDKDASDKDRAAALAKLGIKSGVINNKAGEIITAAAAISEINKDTKMTDAEKIAATSRQLQTVGLLDKKNNNLIVDSTDLYTRARAGDVKGVGDIGERYGMISNDANNNLHYYADLYELSQKDPDSIIKNLTSDESTIIDQETKDRLKKSYNLFNNGKKAYNTIKHGSTNDRIQLASNTAINTRMIDKETIHNYNNTYNNGLELYNILNNGSSSEILELASKNGLVIPELETYLSSVARFYDAYENDDLKGVLNEVNKLSKKEGNGEFYYA